MMLAKQYLPRVRGYSSQDYHWCDQYLTAEFKEALPERDHLYIYDRMTTHSMLSLLDLIDLFESPEEKMIDNIRDPQLVIMPS